MKAFKFHLPTDIRFGVKSIQLLSTLLPSHFQRILVVTEKNVAEKTAAVDSVLKQLNKRKVFVFTDVEENPSFESVQKGGLFAIEHGVDLIIGVGGGSPMDAAKGIAMAATNLLPVSELITLDELPHDPLPVVCIPTTSGTGSEVTPYAVFTDRKSKNKCGYGNDKLFPILALVDPQFAATMPASVVVNTGLDALTHSIEAFLSMDSFPLDDLLAIESIKQVIKHLPLAVKGKQDSVEAMSYAALLGGIAITHGGTILLHIMAYPLTVFHGIPHGKANAILLPAVMQFLRFHSTVRNKIQILDELFSKVGGMEHFIKQIGVSSNLRDYGISKGEFPEFVKKVIIKGDIKITPAKVSETDILTIYLSTY